MKQITIIGNLGKDAETSSKGGAMNFTVGVSDDVDKTKTDWFNCYYDNMSLISYMRKGKYVAISGRFYTKEGSDGKTRLNINVDSVKFINTGTGVKKKSEVADESEAPF